MLQESQAMHPIRSTKLGGHCPGHKRGRSLGQALHYPSNIHSNHDQWLPVGLHGEPPASKKYRPAPPPQAVQISDGALPPADAHDTYSHAPPHHYQGMQLQNDANTMRSPAACPNFPPTAPVPGWLPLPPSSWNAPVEEMRGRSMDMRRDSSHNISLNPHTHSGQPTDAFNMAYGQAVSKSRPQLPPLTIASNGMLPPGAMHPNMFPPTPALSQTEEQYPFGFPGPFGGPGPSSMTPVSFQDGSRPSSAAPLKEFGQRPLRVEDIFIESYVDLEEGQYWYDDSDLSDPNLSLGEIIWRPGVIIYSAMPSNMEAAESWAKYPVPRPKSNSRQTISKYTMADQSNLVKRCMPVQQTQDWMLVKDDPIFRDLSSTLTEDDFCTVTAAVTKIPVQKIRHQRRATMATPINHRITGQARQVLNSAPPRVINEQNMPQMDRRIRGMTPDGLLSLQQPQQPTAPAQRPMPNPLNSSIKLAPPFEFKPSASSKPAAPRSRSNSPQRPSSPTKIEILMPDLKIPTKASKPERPPRYERSQDQEDILAMLGVTGSPKAVYNVPGPARNPSPVRSRSASPDKEVAYSGRPTYPAGSLTTICEDADPGPDGLTPRSSQNVMGEISGNIHHAASVRGGGKKRNRHDSVDLGSLKRQRDGELLAMQKFQFPGAPVY